MGSMYISSLTNSVDEFVCPSLYAVVRTHAQPGEKSVFLPPVPTPFTVIVKGLFAHPSAKPPGGNT